MFLEKTSQEHRWFLNYFFPLYPSPFQISLQLILSSGSRSSIDLFPSVISCYFFCSLYSLIFTMCPNHFMLLSSQVSCNFSKFNIYFISLSLILSLYCLMYYAVEKFFFGAQILLSSFSIVFNTLNLVYNISSTLLFYCLRVYTVP